MLSCGYWQLLHGVHAQRLGQFIDFALEVIGTLISLLHRQLMLAHLPRVLRFEDGASHLDVCTILVRDAICDV